MKKQWKRLLICLCGAMLLPLCLGVVGCAPADDGNDENEGENEQNEQNGDNTEVPSAELVTFLAGGACEYTVVRPEMSPNVTDAAVLVRDTLQALSGSAVKISDDYVDRGVSVPTDTLEILVGLTNRQESIDAHAALKETEYVIKVVGKRLVIVGYDDNCTIAATKAFAELIPTLATEESGAKTLALASDYSYLDTYVVKVWLNEFDKTSYSYYADKNLKYDEEELLGLDYYDDCDYKGSFEIESPVGEGIGFKTDRDNTHWTLISTPTDSFSLEIYDKFTQTIKMWVYVNDTDLMACDHDAVYNTPQVGSQTLYITLSEKQGGVGHTWQHTFYGSGWHEIELSFTCHNVAYPNLGKINYENLTSLTAWCNAKAGLEIYFDSMRVCEYRNPNYDEPEAPYNGRWLTTCDYDALDGPILTEWYGSYYDLDEKVQGNASLAITGHKENVDHRVCIGIDDVDVVYDEDTVCFDMYISDLSLLGTDWQIRFEHNAQAAHYSINYSMIQSSVVDDNMNPTSLKNGWNHIQLPLNKTRVAIGDAYKNQFTNDLTLTQLVFYIAGTGKTEEQNYLIRYDNMYVAKTADLQAAREALN
ncbi:MAG: hypothetical protein IJW40_06865 [Clostridia bacterium]|nr:hypothetical protein [Clostridia bacterium]